MNNYFKSEFKRALFSKKSLLSLLIIFICLIVGCIEFIVGAAPLSIEKSLYIFSEAYVGGFYSILIFASPVLCSIPFASSYIDEKNSGMYDYIIVKIGKKEYFKTKLIVNALVGGLVLSFGVMCFYLLLLVMFGVSSNDLQFLDLNQHIGNLYKNQFLYVMLEIFFMFIFGFTFSNLSLCLSRIIKNKYLSLLSPLFYYLISSVILINISTYLNSQILYSLQAEAHISILPRIIHAVVLNSICVMIYVFSIKFEEKSLDIEISRRDSVLWILYLVLFLVAWFKFKEFIYMFDGYGNLYDFLLYIFNDLYTIGYFIPFCFLFMVYDIYSMSQFNMYKLMRYPSRASYILNVIKSMSLCLIKFMCILVFFCILVSCSTLDIYPTWNNISLNSSLISVIANKYNPIVVVVMSILLVYAYTLALSILCFIITMRTKHNFIGLIVIVLFNTLCLGMLIGRIDILNKINFIYNALFTVSLTVVNTKTVFTMIEPYVYWVIVITSIIYFGIKKINTIDI